MANGVTRADTERGVRQNAYTGGATSLRDVNVLVDMVEHLRNNETLEAIQLVYQDKFLSTSDVGSLLNIAAVVRIINAVAPIKANQNRQDW